VVNRYHLIFLFVITLLNGCAAQNTRVVEEWRDPDAQQPFKHILVIGLLTDPGYEFFLEQGIAKVIRDQGITASIASKVLPRLHEMERAEIEQQLRANGIDGVLLVRPIGQETLTTYVPAHLRIVGIDNNIGWYGYWYQSYRFYRVPDTSYDTFVLESESALFDVASEEAVWTLLTDTDMVLESPSDAVDSLVKSISAELELPGKS
jgi:hypothetical protein